MVFAFTMAILTGILIYKVLGGSIGANALGDGQAAGVLTATLIIIGTAVGSLGNALIKLSEDTPPPPRLQVPETAHSELVALIAQLAANQNSEKSTASD